MCYSKVISCLKILVIIASIGYICHSCNSNTKTAEAGQEVWISLFNGKDLTGWDIKVSGFPLNENYKDTFIVEDSIIRVRYHNYESFDDAFGHIYYQEPFSYYKLRFDYRFVGDQLKGGASWNVRNSGIMLHSQSAKSNELNQDFPVSVELQLLGGLGQGDRHTANVCTPGTAVEIDGRVTYDHCIESSSATYEGDQWVQVVAVVLGGESIHFIVEGDTVLQFQRPQISDGFIAVNDSLSDWEKFGIIRDKDLWRSKAGEVLNSGYIALQAESHPIDFKNIELLNLCGCMDPNARNFKVYYLKDDPKACIY